MEEPYARGKSLLSTLLGAGAEALDIYLAERISDGEWDFAFWNYDPDGVMCTYRCPLHRSIWVPVETPSYTGRAEPYERPEEQHSKKPWHGDPDPK